MIWLWFWGCSAPPEYGVPSADIFFSEDVVEGILYISTHRGDPKTEATCTTVYSLEGTQETCDDCVWDASFTLTLLSEVCLLSEIEQLRFQVVEDRWMVLEQTGWEQWGDAVMVEEGAWSLQALYALQP
ncbi:MAG: hypothetical protein VX278_05975 [Myxococcota bacterium]|nr:hypothetical protein [Myxococcota bacterium]